MTTAEGFAPAKINLTLHVTGQREDGYHLLDSLVVFADVGDRLTYQAGAELSLEVDGPFSEGVPTDARNLVWRAAEACGWSGHIRLEKNLPHGAGIGGGSSDAAAVLRDLGGSADRALALGADVPVCLKGRAARMRGIGEEITHVTLPTLPTLLVNPGVAVPTSQVFAGLPDKNGRPMPATIPAFATIEGCADWLKGQRNDMEQEAIRIAPEIKRVLGNMRNTRDVLLTRMSGSGATCFALYPSQEAAHTAADEIAAEHTDWWCCVTMLS